MSSIIPVRTCAEITSSNIQWLWKPFIARGRITLLDGDPGTGKSLFAIDFAARLSRGAALPDGQKLDRPNVTLLLNAEDDPADTTRPRALAAGADPTRVIVADLATVGPPQLPDCVEDLVRIIREHKVDLLVIDPLSAFLPTAALKSDSSIRKALAPLAGAAAETGCAVLIVRHLANSVGSNAVYRGAGSIGAHSLALTGLLLARHPQEPDTRVLAVTKAHLGPPPAALGFRASATDVGPAIRWLGAVDLSAEELCVSRAAEAAKRPRERAAEFLREALASGPRPVAELQKLAAEKGMSWGTVKRAKEWLKYESEMIDAGGKQQAWQWFDPKQDAAECAAKRKEIAALGRSLNGLRRRTGDELDG